MSRFAAASLALGACTGCRAETASAAFPLEVLAEWVEVELERDPENTPLVVLHGADRAAALARAAVTSLWAKAQDTTEAFVRELARDPSSTVRIAAAAALGRLLELAPPAERIELVCRWTASEEATVRTALARALSLPTAVFVADLAITELSRDPNPEVRAAVIGAIRSHVHVDPRSLTAVATALAADADPSVRSAAQQLLETLSA